MTRRRLKILHIYLPTNKCFAFLVLTMAAFNVLSPPTRTCPVKSSPSAVRNDGACWNYNCRKLPKCGPFPSVVAVSEAEDRRKLNSMPSAKVFGLSNSYGSGRKPGPLHATFPSTPAEVSSVKELFEFICKGPLLEKIGVTSEKVAESIDNWILYGSQLCRLFKLNATYLTEPQKIRIYHYYIPVFLWCEQEISHHSSMFKEEDEIPPLVIGFSAPQGCGKTTLVFALDFLFQLNGRKSATISIDDFYLTANEQAKLKESNPGNGLLEFRGNAGSHDLQLSVETLTALRSLTKEGAKIKIPRYNKHAFNGRGDRADPAKWPEMEGPLTVVLFEGWMLGFKPVPVEVVKSVDPQLEIVNKNLEAYYDAWDKFIKSWIIIKIHDPVYVYQWRLQAEIAMRNDGKPGMSDEEVMDFVSRYLPAYKAYLPTLYSEGPKCADPNHLLVVEIDEGRNPILGN